MNSNGLVGNTQSAADLAAPTSPYRADCARVWAMTTGGTAKRLFNCWRTPGLHALAVYRFGRWLKRQSFWLRCLLELPHCYLAHRVRVKWGIELSPGADIGAGCYIGHFGGIFVGPATIGRHCNLSQGVTIGVSGRGDKEGCPAIGDHVYIAPGAKLFGKITIGHRVKIGANAVIYRDIPDMAIVAMKPGFEILSYKGNY